MKKLIIYAISMFLLNICLSQTAVNFNCQDCSGENHDLFSELDAGKIIVICWVMPCGSCVGPALTTYNVVSSFEVSHPDQVYMYLVDDYANTNCTSLNSWATSYGLNKATLFSNSAINMMDYGSVGMPKVVVVGDVSHAVFYNSDNTVNGTALQEAINVALNSLTTNIEDKAVNRTLASFPNPSNNSFELVFTLERPTDVVIRIQDLMGKSVFERIISDLHAGENNFKVSTHDLKTGMYFLSLQKDNQMETIMISVTH